MFVLSIIGIFAFVGLILWIAIAAAAKRKKALQELAPTLGLTFEPGPFTPGQAAFAATAGFSIFNQGHYRKISNVLHGRIDGIDIHLFEFSYREGHGERQQTYELNAVMLSADGFMLPSILGLHPEGFLSKIGAALGGQDINFPEYPEFSRRFVLKGSDESYLRALIDAPTAAFFEAHQGVSVQGQGQSLLFYRGWRLVKPADMTAFVNEALAVFRTLSASAARLRGGTVAPAPMPPPLPSVT